MNPELHRALRHGVAPLVALLVSRDFLPQEFAGDVTEFAVILLAWAIPYVWSLLRDKANA